MRLSRSVQIGIVLGCISLYGCSNREGEGYSYGSVTLKKIEFTPQEDIRWVEARVQNPIVNDEQLVVGYLFLFASPIETTEGKIESVFIRQKDSFKQVKKHGEACHVYINEEKKILGIKWLAE